MKKISKKERLEYWKFLCAHHSLQRAGHLAKHLSKTDHDDELFYSMFTSLYVLYGRPFKQRKSVRLPDEFIPDHFRTLHEILIELRDKSVAHIDCDRITDDGTSDFNKMIINIKDGAVTGGFANKIPKGFQFDQVAMLCEELQKKCSYHLEKIWKKSMKNWPPRNGSYEVNLAEEDAYLIRELNFDSHVIEIGKGKLLSGS